MHTLRWYWRFADDMVKIKHVPDMFDLTPIGEVLTLSAILTIPDLALYKLTYSNGDANIHLRNGRIMTVSVACHNVVPKGAGVINGICVTYRPNHNFTC